MKISVVIPAYNSVAYIQATLDSVLRQTVPPDEILVLDDGSTDNTVAILKSYKPHITVYQQENKGVASARNVLCQRAQGELIAFLDSDDIWHPNYLEAQRRLYGEHPNAVALFTGHVNFYGHDNYQWHSNPFDRSSVVELIEPLSFFKRYNEATGPFASMSYCCVSKRILKRIGEEPFNAALNIAEDSYFLYLLALQGPVVYNPVALAAYRIRKESLSSNRLWTYESLVRAFELLEERFRNAEDAEYSKAFEIAFASKRRQYAKSLMGAGKVSEARTQFWR